MEPIKFSPRFRYEGTTWKICRINQHRAYVIQQDQHFALNGFNYFYKTDLFVVASGSLLPRSNKQLVKDFLAGDLDIEWLDTCPNRDCAIIKAWYEVSINAFETRQGQ